MDEKTPLFTIDEIIKILPHRFPFILVDRVIGLSIPDHKSKVGRRVTAIKNVTINEPYFPGHFPHRPVMPGVLQIETMAQVAALAVVDLNGPRMDTAIAGIDKARFRKPVIPGDQLMITAEILKDRGQIFFVRCEAKVDGVLVSEVELIAKVFPIEAVARN
jgi:beta-hydroxyacyl-ACP dehydratase FabZ